MMRRGLEEGVRGFTGSPRSWPQHPRVWSFHMIPEPHSDASWSRDR